MGWGMGQGMEECSYIMGGGRGRGVMLLSVESVVSHTSHL